MEGGVEGWKGRYRVREGAQPAGGGAHRGRALVVQRGDGAAPAQQREARVRVRVRIRVRIRVWVRVRVRVRVRVS